MHSRLFFSGTMIAAMLCIAVSCHQSDPVSPSQLTKPFVFPLHVGATWKYRFVGGVNATTIGLHIWRVLSTDGSGNWTCMDSRVDSVGHIWQTVNDSLTFVIREFTDSTQIEFPEWMGLFTHSREVPKTIAASKDTISFEGQINGGTTGSESVAYVNGVGLVQYEGKQPGMTGGFGSISLIEYSPP